MKKEKTPFQLQHQAQWLWLEETYKDLMSRLALPTGMEFKPGQKPNAEQIAAMAQRLDVIEQQLAQPINREELARSLEVLFSGFPARNYANVVPLAGAYIFSLSDFSRYLIEKALQDFLKGLVPEQNMTYPPTPAFFATHCRNIEKSQRIKINLMRKKFALKESC
ncbi:hypothetical protein [Bartonella sp. TP]|uniref:hypothetical protein n=1 Tax=Bartonella sp. TP TaxID=3057550 RepID=UPI0025B1D681|nr:hypothetical protein [Bartonella sp. TP]MDN5249176.1 hypothetical protein [Alphaproteobacteria bacterium]WJW80483.1 hypothetical protein QVL57_02655 [Bartonella sp. TP]